MFPCLHAPQHLLLAVGRHTVEPLQPLLQPLLTFRRKTPELRVVFQRAPLLIERLIAVLIQPLARMMSLCWGLISSVFS